VNNKQYSFYAKNPNFCPFQILIEMEIPEKMQATDAIPFYDIVPEKTTDYYLFSILTEEPTQDLKFDFKRRYSIGDPNLVPDLDYKYVLPFKEGEAYKLTQSYNGIFSHRGWTRFSLDFGMDTGSTICATRDGVVTDVRIDSNKGGRYYKYRYMANYITIYHEDGTFSQYMHLKKNGSVVKVGDKVKKGDIIGFSGNTGWSRGPHLHFMVFKPTKLFYETVPTKFIGEKNILDLLEPFKFYFSYHKRDFDLYDGSKVASKNDLDRNKDDNENDESFGGF